MDMVEERQDSRSEATKILDEVGPFRLAAWLFFFFLLAGALAIGMRELVTAEGRERFRGIVLLVSVSIILVATARKWAKWIAPLCLFGAFRLAVVALLGRTVSVPSLAVPRLWALAGAGTFVIVSYLSYRFRDEFPTSLDSICLVGAILAFTYSQYVTNPYPSLSIGFAAVLFAFMMGKHSKKKDDQP